MSDDFNFDGEQSRRQGAPMQMWDILSIVALLLTACVGAYFVFVLLNPTSSYNILRAGGRGPQVPTLTATPQQLHATWTPSPTLSLTASTTPTHTLKPLLTNTLH